MTLHEEIEITAKQLGNAMESLSAAKQHWDASPKTNEQEMAILRNYIQQRLKVVRDTLAELDYLHSKQDRNWW